MRSKQSHSWIAQRLRWTVAAGVAGAALAVGSAFDSSGELPQQPEMIRDALVFHLTVRGQNYFYDHLEEILADNGIAFRSGSFSGVKYEAAQPLQVDNLPERYKKYAPVLKSTATLVKQWLMGTPIQSPRFKGAISDIGYDLRFSRFGIRPDLKATQALPSGGGVVLLFEAEMPEVQLFVKKIRGSDLNNAFLGEVGANRIQAKIGASGVPLRIQLPFVMRPVRGGSLELRALGIRTNLDGIPASLRYQKPLLLPQVEVRINGHSFQLNQAALEQSLERKLPELVPPLLAYLKEALEQELVPAINSFLAENVKAISEIHDMDPLGAPSKVPARDRIRWGMLAEGIDLDRQQNLKLEFSAFFDDQRSKVPGLSRQLESKTVARPSLDPASYDLALGVNQGVANRLLQLSFARGYFSEVKTCEGTKLKLVAMPQLRLDQSRAFNHARMRIKVEAPSPWYTRLFLKGRVQVEVDLDLTFENHPTLGPRLLLASIDPASLKLDEESTRIDSTQGFFRRKIAEMITKSNADPKCQNQPLTDEMPLPAAVFGVPFRIKQLQVDPNGNLLIYVNFGGTKR